MKSAVDSASEVRSPRAGRSRRAWITGSVVGAVLLALLGGSLVYTERSSFCPACHEMQPYYTAWQASGHASEAQCVDCHVDAGIIAHLAHKPTALKEVWDHFTKDNRFPNYSVAVPDGRCVRCHPKVVKKIGARFDHALHEKKGRCQDCHAITGHLVTLEALRTAGILKEGAGMPAIPTGATPSTAAGHKKVVCQQCHDQAKMKCSQCHQAPHDDRGECSDCHKTGEKFVFVHPSTAVDCASCHKKPAKHPATTASCTTCHSGGGKSWAFVHPKSTKCADCHKAPANHYGTDCTRCHKTTVPFANATLNHPRTAEHSYRSFACVKCHPSGYATASCTCHGGRPPSGD